MDYIIPVVLMIIIGLALTARGQRIVNRHMLGGVLCIIGGVSGQVVLVGTESGGPLIALGGVLVLWGFIQMVHARSRGKYERVERTKAEGNLIASGEQRTGLF